VSPKKERKCTSSLKYDVISCRKVIDHGAVQELWRGLYLRLDFYSSQLNPISPRLSDAAMAMAAKHDDDQR
jgi:hypothetical protein